MEKTVREALQSRYTCRKFSEALIEQEKLDFLVKAAEQSPTAMNAQELRFRFVFGTEKLKKLGHFFEKYYLKYGDEEYAERLKARGGQYFYNALLMILVSARNSVYDEETYTGVSFDLEKNREILVPEGLEKGNVPMAVEVEQVSPSPEQAAQDSRRSIYFDPGYSQVDAGIAIQSLALAAESVGLTSCILGSPVLPFRADLEEKDNMYQSFCLEQDEEVLLGLLVGYSAEEKKKAPHKTERTRVYFIK